MPTSNVEEPLEESVRLATQLARLYCCDCGWYHGFWQHLRLMGMGKTLSGLPHLFLQAIARHQDQPGLRVLVSGAADYSALAHVVHGLGGVMAVRRNSVHLVVLDRCETPLTLNRWYAQRHEVPVEHFCADALDFHSIQPFDLIITSSFLGYFQPEQRRQLFARYASLLSPTGRLVFANRLRPGLQHVAVGFGAEEARRFQEKAKQANAQLAEPLQWRDDQLAAAATAYTDSFQSYPVNSLESLTLDLETAGLAVKHHQLSKPQLPIFAKNAGLSGPSTAGDSAYVFIEAGFA